MRRESRISDLKTSSSLSRKAYPSTPPSPGVWAGRPQVKTASQTALGSGMAADSLEGCVGWSTLVQYERWEKREKPNKSILPVAGATRYPCGS